MNSDIKKMYCEQLGISEKVYDYSENIIAGLKERFEKIDETAEYNQMKVINAMQKNHVAEMHLMVQADMAIMMTEEIRLSRFMQIYSRLKPHL